MMTFYVMTALAEKSDISGILLFLWGQTDILKWELNEVKALL